MANEDDRLVFEVNGQRFELPEVDPSTTLLHFLRSQTSFKSPKLSCAEGGCGACVVVLSKFDPVLNRAENFSVSSCLTLLCTINGCSVTTSEGLGNSRDGFHPIHRRFAGFHASQCGFCTPGMCMSLFSAISAAESSGGPPPPPGFSKLTVADAEKAISGNLCRCTGYRPIVDACKSFAADVDLEDLGINSFWRKGDSMEVRSRQLPAYSPKDHACLNDDPSSYVRREARRLNSGKHSWFTPASIAELQELLQLDSAGNAGRVKLVVGNTGNGYYKETERFDKYIDLRYIRELSVVRKDAFGVEFGAALSISKVVMYLKREGKSRVDPVFDKIADHIEKIASPFIRNSASLGGNLVMAQRKDFPSDIATLLLAVGSSVVLLSGRNREKLSMEEFLSRPAMDAKDVVLTVSIPFLEPSRIDGSIETSSRLLFKTYRAAPRPLGNALPYMNAAFLADVSFGKDGRAYIDSVKLAFGAYGAKHATRAKKVEDYLAGKMVTVEVVDEAIKLAKDAIVVPEETSHAAYRSSLAVGFLFEFLNSFSGINSAISPASDSNGSFPEGAGKSIIDTPSIRLQNSTILSSAKQVVESSSDYYPVGEPMIKSGSAIQASGEAVYVDDIPSPPNCLHGSFIYSTKPLARVKAISLDSREPADVAAVITAKDIPAAGKNIGSMSVFSSEPLFAEEITRFAGDLVALVVAETRKSANQAAESAQIEYDTEGLDPPILTVEEAVERSSYFQVPPFLYPAEVGDFSKGMDSAEHKILSAEIRLGSQYYFYMETQTALAIPDEDNCMTVYSSSQCPESAHRVIAKCLGVPDHNIRVLTRRVGGGFGGKALKSIPIAVVCALAAHKLRRPVRIYLDRKTDMVVAGGRHPMKVTYSVGFKSDGKITALRLDILINAGITEDISPILPHNVIGSLKKYNWGALSFDIKVCKMNHSSKSAMRGPGEVQGSYIAEAVIEHVASFLLMEADAVRIRNLHSFDSLKLFHGSISGEASEFTLPYIWDKLAGSCNLGQRVATIEEFNASNVWRKRGISRVPVVQAVIMRPAPGKVSILWDGSVVVEVGGIELGQGLWTKVRQVTAYALASIKCDGLEDLVEKVRVVQADTLSLVQGGFTAGSTTSESSCAAVRLCCNELVERLKPVKDQLQKQRDGVKWNDLILQANTTGVGLAVNSMFAPDPSSISYLNYGAAVSEVEVNILTGATTILRTDIVYDCGQSMNPAVDLGQVEGAFVQGLGFFMLEEYLSNPDGLAAVDGTWNYKIPTIDTIPKQFNVEILNSGHHQKRVLSSKASGEPPLLLAAAVHCAARAAVKAARKQLERWGCVDGIEQTFHLDVPATMPVVKRLCGMDAVETYLKMLSRVDKKG
ncbi:abscisic-aldehyde oxidase-like [Andrographis paniculata]|uniref:abscisic-aldehyde oxidase-like n=1 Tax=Andrographis paniculata TaxID=175694 RepID=UPI0021E9AE0D|nr:abscisic-aldehyde oxidase-like [Andrographis paniculata]